MVILQLIPGCVYETPPDAISVQQIFLNNEDNIQVVVEYLTSIGYENVYITGASDSMLADLSDIAIDDPAVCSAVNQLLDEGEYVDIKKRGNTIAFEQWNGLHDIGCGVAYSINGTDLPEILFLVELTPISKDSWFYYTYDYNAWRNQKN